MRFPVPDAPPPLPLHPKIFPAPLPKLRIAVGCIHAIAICATVFRIAYRRYKRNTGLDDTIAGVACFCAILFMTTFMLRNNEAGLVKDPARRRGYIVLNWFQQLLGPTVLWLCRLSMILGIDRLVPYGRSLKLVTTYLPYAFICMYLAVIGARCWACGASKQWHNTKAMQCFLSQPVPQIEITFDLLADFALIGIPLVLLWNIRLNKYTKSRVILVFITTVLMTLGNIVFTVFVFGAIHWGGTIIVSVMGHVESTLALLVCNLTVILPFCFRAIGLTDEGDSPVTSERPTGLTGSIAFKAATVVGESTTQVAVHTEIHPEFDIELKQKSTLEKEGGDGDSLHSTENKYNRTF